MVDFTAKSKDSTAMFMTGDADGVMDLKGMWEPIDVGGGPMAGLEGPCFGAARLTRGMMTGDGYCAFKDPDGHTALVHWWMENAASPQGTWALVGGTGEWATATGGGLFANAPNEGEDFALIEITGMVDVK